MPVTKSYLITNRIPSATSVAVCARTRDQVVSDHLVIKCFAQGNYLGARIDGAYTCFYNQRGLAEEHIKEGKCAFYLTRRSCRRFSNNEIRLQLHALATT